MGDTTDDDLDVVLKALAPYWRSVTKAVLIAMMMMSAIYVSSNSIWKTLAFGGALFFVACFNTWRRYLEPISLVLFLAAIGYVCIDFSNMPKVSFALVQ